MASERRSAPIITLSLASSSSIMVTTRLPRRAASSAPSFTRLARSAPADGIDFIDEDDAGRILLGLLEHVAHARRADADEHLDEIGTRNREERHVGFAGDGAGEQGLAGARRADQQHAFRDAAAQPLEF